MGSFCQSQQVIHPVADASLVSSSRMTGDRRHHPRKTRLGVQAIIIPSKKLCNDAILCPHFMAVARQQKPRTNLAKGKFPVNPQIHKIILWKCCVATWSTRKNQPRADAVPANWSIRRIRRKVSDEFTVPLCRGHHREVHRYGDEAAWRKVGVDPTVTARALWLETRPRTAGRRHHLTT
jgi:hypothetical protein